MLSVEVEAIPTPALPFVRLSSFVLTTLRTPPYERKEEALIQYSYCLSVERGVPKVLINPC